MSADPAINEQQTPAEHPGNTAEPATKRARDPYWDVAKGLLIILMVLGHAL